MGEQCQHFVDIYFKHLRECFEKYPDQYIGDYESTSNRMFSAILRGSFNKDGKAFKLTCKELGIPHTYKAIASYINAN
jgi:hypothetical protein